MTQGSLCCRLLVVTVQNTLPVHREVLCILQTTDHHCTKYQCNKQCNKNLTCNNTGQSLLQTTICQYIRTMNILPVVTQGSLCCKSCELSQLPFSLDTGGCGSGTGCHPCSLGHQTHSTSHTEKGTNQRTIHTHDDYHHNQPTGILPTNVNAQ